MPQARECPMCGETMHLEVREQVDRIPGGGPARTWKVREWVCPECDYFEESEDDEDQG